MSDPQQGCSMAVEDVFGIVNSSCLNGFDFTLLFEEAILTILPLGISSTYSPSHSLPRFAFFPSLTSSYTNANNCQSAGRFCVFRICAMKPQKSLGRGHWPSKWLVSPEPLPRCVNANLIVVTVLVRCLHYPTSRPSRRLVGPEHTPYETHLFLHCILDRRLLHSPRHVLL